MSKEDKLHIQTCYTHIREALDEMARVRDKDLYLAKIHGALFKMEDMLYQYCTEPKERRTT